MNFVLFSGLGVTALLISAGGYLYAPGLVSSLGLFMVFIFLHDILLRERQVFRGAAALIALVAGAAGFLTGSGNLLRFLNGTPAEKAPVWTLPLFLLCMVLGEIARRAGGGRRAIPVILASFVSLLAAAASIMLGESFLIYVTAVSVLINLLLIIMAGRAGYMLSLSLVEKIM